MLLDDTVPPAIQASDLLEQIDRVNRLIERNAQDVFMRRQYEARRQEFVDELNAVLQTFSLKPTEIAA